MALIRMSGAPEPLDQGLRQEWGAVFALSAEPTAPPDPSEPLSAASRAIVVRDSRGQMTIEARAFEEGGIRTRQTGSRAMWLDDQLILLIPVSGEVEQRPVFWDAYSRLTTTAGAVVAADSTRRTNDGRGLWAYFPPPVITFQGDQ